MTGYPLDLWDRAQKALAAARRELAVDPDLAASRAYYAAFYAVSALLAAEGSTFTRHSAVEAAVPAAEAAPDAHSASAHFTAWSRAFERGLPLKCARSKRPPERRAVLQPASLGCETASGHLRCRSIGSRLA